MTNQNNKIIIGIIVDVSSSMQKNWGNNITNNRTKIEVIKDALNDEFKRLKIIYSGTEKQEIYVFCLGMGFILPFKTIKSTKPFKRFNILAVSITLHIKST